jgi:hypothetical protein
MAELGGAFAPTSPADLVNAMCGLFDHVTERNRTLTTAQLVIFMEGSHDPGLRAKVSSGRAAMESWFVPAVAHLGARDPQVAAQTIIACFEGLVLHRIARHDETDPRPSFDLVVGAALS